MRVGVLTGGGDAPGLNAAIRAVARAGWREGYTIVGIRNGWLGLLTDDLVELTPEDVRGILHRGGTILGTSRTNPFKEEGGPQRVMDCLRAHEIDALVAIGGDDTLGVAQRLLPLGLRVVGIPKTMDNDIPGTDYTIGFDTAVNVVMDACDKLHPTAEAHHRVMVVEVMGRDAGWVAAVGGLAGGADIILVPEVSFTIDEVCERIRARHNQGKSFSILVVAEGARATDIGMQITQEAPVDAFGHVRLGGIGNVLAREIEARTGYETRVTVLGHLQRGGSPTVFDRVLATRFGVAAIEMIRQGRFGVMVALRGNRITSLPLEEALVGEHKLDLTLYELANIVK
ncbi:MAG: ATP-dependent 6-phosphofructokinase [Armatimonadota bacterium]|nr:ATP-dependent 6-phosphofructokinase [Armatimonadota bacterium]MDR7427673.1 ATP-dependent 6-phosphofructokinase [Armatimonadota bacterium]MDR7464011.1 ATP-dependent 6-phosphofructokinase [Armatimonadota bacterium]MDR7470300.1 ATP-dependent 6-phosphofructokinase [Armatimonadota bacterium]MDR7475399.1 ATP-dependent 6-phosphofructokinase [Armatimonadota bacterium]